MCKLFLRFALYFRDCLMEFPDIASEQGKLKLSLWKEYEYNRDAYTNAKTEFVKNVLKKRNWFMAIDIYKGRAGM